MKKLFTLSLVAALATAQFAPVHAIGGFEEDRGILSVETRVTIIKGLAWGAVLLGGAIVCWQLMPTQEQLAQPTEEQLAQPTEELLALPMSCPLVPAFGDSIVDMNGSPLNGMLVDEQCVAALPVSCGIPNSENGFNPGYLVSTRIMNLEDQTYSQTYSCQPVSCPTELLTTSNEPLYGKLQANESCLVENDIPCLLTTGQQGFVSNGECITDNVAGILGNIASKVYNWLPLGQ